MKKNVVWWPAIVNEEHKDKYGGYDYFEYSFFPYPHHASLAYLS